MYDVIISCHLERKTEKVNDFIMHTYKEIIGSSGNYSCREGDGPIIYSTGRVNLLYTYTYNGEKNDTRC